MTDRTRTHRSGVNTMFLWMGIALVMLGLLLFGAFPVLAWSLTRSPGLLMMLLGLPVFAVAGAVMALVGGRRRLLIAADRVTWYGAFGGPTSVPYAEIAHVEVPTGRRGPGAVRLHRHDGGVVVLGALAMSSGEGGNHPDGAYSTAARELVTAHSRWWELHRSSHGRRPAAG